MSAENWAEVRALFDATVDLPPDAREAHLLQATGDPVLRGEVRSLLAADALADSLETPLVRVLVPAARGRAAGAAAARAHDGGAADAHAASSPGAGSAASPGFDPDLDPGSDADADADSGADMLGLRAGDHIGAYRIVRIIGRGGMGIVYLGERADDAYHRQVAIKVVRPGFAVGDVAARFAHERRTLAALTHPNIARLYDGGTTALGDSYFVMELVDGVPVDRYCDERCLSIDERLDLFRTICVAVQNAHEHLVVHRDIKPDNILVERDGTPKLLDFGVAKLVSHESGGEDDAASFAATWWMTPDYASPEQVSGRARVTTASDVYSLGVLLHVLLTGVRPYDLHGPTPAAIHRQLVAATLTPPSVRAAEKTEAARERAARRRTTPAKLASRLAGDLDAIVARALAVDLSARYSTVEQLSRDLERHRTHYPVNARKRDLAYVARTFIRRHRVALAVSVSAVLLLAAGVGAVVWQAKIAAEARARAERRFEDVRRLALTFMFDVHDAIVNVPGTTDARALMVRTAVTYLENLAREAAGDRTLQRELAGAFVKVGDAQGHPTSPNVGDSAGARRSYGRAIEIAEMLRAEAARDRTAGHARVTPAAPPAAAADAGGTAGTGGSPASSPAAAAAAGAAGAAGAGAAGGGAAVAAAAAGGATAAVAAAAGDAAAGADDVEATRTLAMAHRRLADVLAWGGEVENALVHCEQSARYFAIVATSGDAPTLEDRLQMSAAQVKLGDLLGNPNFPNLSRAADASARYAEALAGLRALDAAAPGNVRVRRFLGIALERIGTMHEQTNAWTDAMAAYRESFDIRQALAAAQPFHVDIQRDAAIAYEKLGNVERAAGKLSQALGSYRGALAQFERLAKADPANAAAARTVAIGHERIGDTLLRLGQSSDAARHLREALVRHRGLAAADPGNAQARCDEARVAEGLGDLLARPLPASGPIAPATPACRAWRESDAAIDALRKASLPSCQEPADRDRLSAKLRRCS